MIQPPTQPPGVVKKTAGRPPKSKVPYVVDRASGCWVWQRGKNHRGYGLLWNGEKMVAAHRHYYLHMRGPIPDGMQLDHLCRNRACVNPDHLEVVDGTENTRRGNATKLTADQVREIHLLHAAGLNYKQLGRRFGVSAIQASRIVRGKRWVDSSPRPAAERGSLR